MRSRGAVLVFVAALLVGAAGCSAQPGTAVPRDWTGSPVYASLKALPATTDSLFEIGLVDARKLNALDQYAEKPKSTTAPASGLRPPSDYAWTNYSIAGSACALLETSYQALPPGYRAGPPGDLLTVYNGKPTPDTTVGVCHGEVNLDVLGKAAKPRSIGGVAGVDFNGLWIGQTRDLTFQLGPKVDPSVTPGLLAGASVTTSLADDPGVTAVLAANPQAAMIEMGTIFVGLAGLGSSSKALRQLVTDAAAAQGTTLPNPVFGGYGWTPGTGLTGTATFVTRYSVDQQATTAGALLSATWPKATGTPFAGATTTVTGSVVITRLADAKVDLFNLRTMRLADYPGYGAKNS
jgi:hypothetical protein